MPIQIEIIEFRIFYYCMEKCRAGPDIQASWWVDVESSMQDIWVVGM